MFMETPEYQILAASHPHIAKEIMLLWGSYEMNDYFDKLFEPSRVGKRKGFKLEVAQCLLKIIYIHKKEFPQFMFNIESHTVEELI